MKLLKIVFLLSLNIISAQTISSDWTPINSDDESTIYLNSSKIIGYGNEISVWAIEKLEKASEINSGEKVNKIKTHYLFNKMKKRYAEIGVIYYDKKGQIINRSSKSNFQGTSAAFMTPINSDPKVEIIYKEVVSFLITGNIESIIDTSESNFNKKEDKNIQMEIPATHRQLAEKHKEDIQTSKENESISEISLEEINPNSNDTSLQSAKLSKNIDNSMDLTKEDWNNIPQIESRLEILEKPTLLSLSEVREHGKFKLDDTIIIHELSQKTYHFKNERALKNAIFTDGNLYCFQVSSWKTKAYADRELNKLVKEGYNAFLVSVKPKHKRSIWHRVRVGYFNSLEETKGVQKLVGRR